MAGRVRGRAVIDADVEIRRCLDDRKSFLVDAGAGSGKTSSLVGALRHLIDTQLGAALAQNSQRIACITFTNVATDQIVERTARNPLIHVSTIHDFLWSVIKPHQKALKRALLRHNRELKGTSARKRDEAALEAALPGVSVTYSDRGAEFLEGRLFHDDLIEVAARAFEDNALMAQIVGARFPFIFVDEYQDTSRLVIGILDRVMTAAQGKAVVGYFGRRQKITAARRRSSPCSTGFGRTSSNILRAKTSMARRCICVCHDVARTMTFWPALARSCKRS
jgi:DNA helicase-2/ATP-dependent DNA helicase PcrA